MREELHSAIIGAMVGSAIGDAFGGPVEMLAADALWRVAGKLWVDEMLPWPPDRKAHPLGIWQPCPPRGTGTDDLRNNHAFVQCVIRNRGAINSQLLAIEYIERYRDRHELYPDHVELAERYLRGPYLSACAYLGMKEIPGGGEGWVVQARGNAFPSLSGLISLAFAGLLHIGDPEAAYRKAFELDFLDIGYARDATAMLAAMVSVAAAGQADARRVVEVGLETDPFGYGERRLMGRAIRRFLQIADAARDDRELINRLAREVGHLHMFDPVDVLGVPATAFYFSNGDPVRTIVMAANDRELDADGNLLRLRDVDCTGGVAGALAGALHGAEAFPQDWVRDALAANRAMYGIDIAENARRFAEAIYGGGV